jgi:hypothetical protein
MIIITMTAMTMTRIPNSHDRETRRRIVVNGNARALVFMAAP